VTEGSVRLSTVPAPGLQCTINLMRQGDLIGCFNSVCTHKHPTEGVALSESTVIVIPKNRYVELLDNPAFSRGIIHILGERLKDMETMRAMVGQSSEKRLAWTLLWVYGKLGRRVPMTRRMIDETAGAARETTIRVLSPMEKKGWLKTRRGMIEIVKPEKLRDALEAR